MKDEETSKAASKYLQNRAPEKALKGGITVASLTEAYVNGAPVIACVHPASLDAVRSRIGPKMCVGWNKLF